MVKKAISPSPTQPAIRLHLGQSSHLLTNAQLGTSADSNATVLPSEYGLRSEALASYDGDEE